MGQWKCDLAKWMTKWCYLKTSHGYLTAEPRNHHNRTISVSFILTFNVLFSHLETFLDCNFLFLEIFFLSLVPIDQVKLKNKDLEIISHVALFSFTSLCSLCLCFIVDSTRRELESWLMVHWFIEYNVKERLWSTRKDQIKSVVQSLHCALCSVSAVCSLSLFLYEGLSTYTGFYFKILALSMHFGLSSTHKQSFMSLKRDLLENSFQSENFIFSIDVWTEKFLASNMCTIKSVHHFLWQL